MFYLKIQNEHVIWNKNWPIFQPLNDRPEKLHILHIELKFPH